MAASSKKEYDYLFKVLLIGKESSGKSSLLNRFAYNSYSDSSKSTMRIDFKNKIIDIDGKKVMLQVWNTSDKEKDKSAYRGAAIAILTCDLTDYESFQNLNRLNETVESYSSNPLTLLAGTKADLVMKRAIDREAIQQKADELKIPYVETSAKNNTGVDKLFEEAARIKLQQLKVAEVKISGTSEQKAPIAINEILAKANINIEDLQECDQHWRGATKKDLNKPEWKKIRDDAFNKLLKIVAEEKDPQDKIHILNAAKQLKLLTETSFIKSIKSKEKEINSQIKAYELELKSNKPAPKKQEQKISSPETKAKIPANLSPPVQDQQRPPALNPDFDEKAKAGIQDLKEYQVAPNAPDLGANVQEVEGQPNQLEPGIEGVKDSEENPAALANPAFEKQLGAQNEAPAVMNASDNTPAETSSDESVIEGQPSYVNQSIFGNRKEGESAPNNRVAPPGGIVVPGKEDESEQDSRVAPPGGIVVENKKKGP